MKLDVVASVPWYVAHLAPVWLALPEQVRGRFCVIRGVGVASDYFAAAEMFALSIGISPDANELPDTGVPALVGSSGDLGLVAKTGRPCAYLGHGIGQSYGGDRNGRWHRSFPGGRGRPAELFMHVGPHPAMRERAEYPEARVEVVGSPYLDMMPDFEPDPGPPVVAVSFHWDSPICNETRSGFHEYRDAVVRLASCREIKVVGHGHPRILDELAPWYERNGIEVVRDFRDIARRASLYACDNSSSMFEFAALGRPVVVINPTGYRRGVEHGLRFWDAASVGINVDAPCSLTRAVIEALSDPPEQICKRERALDLVYRYRSGGAQRAVDVLLEWLASR